LKLQSFSYFKERQGNNYYNEITKGIGALIVNSQIKYIIRGLLSLYVLRPILL